MAGTGHEGLKPEPTGSVDWGNRVQGRRAKGTADSSQRAGLSGRRSRISLLQDAVSQPRRKEGGHSRHEDQQMHWQLKNSDAALPSSLLLMKEASSPWQIGPP